jgi:hypothetical protein
MQHFKVGNWVDSIIWNMNVKEIRAFSGFGIVCFVSTFPEEITLITTILCEELHSYKIGRTTEL